VVLIANIHAMRDDSTERWNDQEQVLLPDQESRSAAQPREVLGGQVNRFDLSTLDSSRVIATTGKAGIFPSRAGTISSDSSFSV